MSDYNEHDPRWHDPEYLRATVADLNQLVANYNRMLRDLDELEATRDRIKENLEFCRDKVKQLLPILQRAAEIGKLDDPADWWKTGSDE